MTDTAPIAAMTDPRITSVAGALKDAGVLIDRVRYARIAIAAADTLPAGEDLTAHIAASLTRHRVMFDVHRIAAAAAPALA